MMRECDVDDCTLVIGRNSLFCRKHLDMVPQGMLYQIHVAAFEKRRNIQGAAERYFMLVAAAKKIIADQSAKAVA